MAQSQNGNIPTYDVVVIGAGLTGLLSIYHLRNKGFTVQAFDDASGVGGTWYWNRYPGCRFDSESYTYGYFFSEELLQEWDWKEHYSGQPENERYFNYVADKFDLKKHIRFNSHVESLQFNEDTQDWTINIEDGYQARGRFVITAVGILSANYVPNFEGIHDFEGPWCHTGKWPKEGMDLKGKKVGVIGTGASGVQLITEIAKEVGHLTVFQRTANFCAPLRNRPITEEEQKEIKSSFPEILEKCMDTAGSFMHKFDPRSAMEVSEEERHEQYERLWQESGFKKWLGNFYDVMLPGEANEDYAEFFRNKIRERVHDPVVAELLVPKDHMFGSKRLPCESGYYEVYNQDNVLLVDVKSAPIERITRTGIKTTDNEYEFDVIIYATGFDAITGSLLGIDIYGRNGESLREKYVDGPKSFMGVMSAGYPNLWTVNAASVGNFPRAAEPLVGWVIEAIEYMRANEFQTIEPSLQSEQNWGQHVKEEGAKILRSQADSWFVGANIPGKARGLLTAPDSAPVMRAKREEIANNNYEGFVLK